MSDRSCGALNQEKKDVIRANRNIALDMFDYNCMLISYRAIISL